jgi:general secretion pathway protein C
MMFSFYQRYTREIFLLLLALLGLACGLLAATLLGSSLRAQATPARATAPPNPLPRSSSETDLAFILQHNLFNSATRSATPVTFSLQTSASTSPPVARGDLQLLGTVVAGSRSLAVLRTGQEVKIYHLGAEIPGGKVEDILRNHVSIRNHNRSVTVLRLHEARETMAVASAADAGRHGRDPALAAGAAGIAADVVRPAGTNRWVVARSAVETARETMGEQLRSVLMQPNLVNGKTDGFVVRRIQPGTLMAGTGLQRGDIIKRVNRMPLDSPEKALQVMQQLREARQITVDLERAGKPLTFAYEIE